VTAEEMVGHPRNPLAGCDRFLIPSDLGQFNQLRRMSDRFDISATAEVIKPKAVMRLELRLQVRYPRRKIKGPSPRCARLFDRPPCPGQRGAKRCLEGHFGRRLDRRVNGFTIKNERQTTLALVV
jgi:hypothetical protein